MGPLCQGDDSMHRRETERLLVAIKQAQAASERVALATVVRVKGSAITNDPAACANCHVMENHYRAWMKTHRSRGIRQISG
jgi:nitrate/TMAO reductase-like tetraheme cytochrome c subunit